MAFIVQNIEITGYYESSFVSMTESVLGQSGKIAVSILAAMIIFANLMGTIWAVSRMVLSLSRERLFSYNIENKRKWFSDFCRSYNIHCSFNDIINGLVRHFRYK